MNVFEHEIEKLVYVINRTPYIIHNGGWIRLDYASESQNQAFADNILRGLMGPSQSDPK